MNIQAINASATLGRRRVPSANSAVSFKGSVKQTAVDGAKAAKGTISNAFKNVKGFVLNTVPNVLKTAASKVKKGTGFLGSKVLDGAKVVGGAFKKGTLKAKDSVADFVAKNKGAKGVKIAATALTAVVATGFAIKEIYDIVTKSNPER